MNNARIAISEAFHILGVDAEKYRIRETEDKWNRKHPDAPIFKYEKQLCILASNIRPFITNRLGSLEYVSESRIKRIESRALVAETLGNSLETIATFMEGSFSETFVICECLWRRDCPATFACLVEKSSKYDEEVDTYNVHLSFHALTLYLGNLTRGTQRYDVVHKAIANLPDAYTLLSLDDAYIMCYRSLWDFCKRGRALQFQLLHRSSNENIYDTAVILSLCSAIRTIRREWGLTRRIEKEFRLSLQEIVGGFMKQYTIAEDVGHPTVLSAMMAVFLDGKQLFVKPMGTHRRTANEMAILCYLNERAETAQTHSYFVKDDPSTQLAEIIFHLIKRQAPTQKTAKKARLDVNEDDLLVQLEEERERLAGSAARVNEIMLQLQARHKTDT